MKRQFAAAVAALLLGSVAVRAQTTCTTTRTTPPWKVSCQGNVNFHFERGKSTPLQAGPWYLYWPMEKEFVVPAPVCAYPFWPARQALPPRLALGPPSPPPAVPVAPTAPGYAAPVAPAAPGAPVIPPVPSTAPQTGTSAPSGLRPAAYSAAMPASPGVSWYGYVPGNVQAPDYWFDR